MAVLVAIILSFVYVVRIRRRVKRIQGSTDVLGPGASPSPSSATALLDCIFLSHAYSPFYIELAPTSPSKSSQISLDLPVFNHDRLPIDPPATPDQIGHDLHLGAQMGSSRERIVCPSESLSVPHILTIAIARPPAAIRRSILHPDTWSPIPLSPIIIAWPSPETRWRDSPPGYLPREVDHRRHSATTG